VQIGHKTGNLVFTCGLSNTKAPAFLPQVSPPSNVEEEKKMGLVPHKKQSLTRAQFEQLADVPPEEEWLANITNLKTRRAYKEDVREFITFTALQDYMGLRSVGRSHVIAWRKDMERRGLAPSTIRRKLSALSSLFDYLCERNAVIGNPVDGVKRPMANGNEGSTPALGDVQARKLLEAPPAGTLKGVRDRAILATLLYHGIRREELCGLRVKDLHSRQGVMHFRVKGKRAKIRFVPVNAAAHYPAHQIPPWSPDGHQRRSSQTCPLGLSYAQIRQGLRRNRPGSL
jgi:site-specific recombinase XerD